MKALHLLPVLLVLLACSSVPDDEAHASTAELEELMEAFLDLLNPSGPRGVVESIDHGSGAILVSIEEDHIAQPGNELSVGHYSWAAPDLSLPERLRFEGKGLQVVGVLVVAEVRQGQVAGHMKSRHSQPEAGDVVWFPVPREAYLRRVQAGWLFEGDTHGLLVEALGPPERVSQEPGDVFVLSWRKTGIGGPRHPIRLQGPRLEEARYRILLNCCE